MPGLPRTLVVPSRPTALAPSAWGPPRQAPIQSPVRVWDAGREREFEKKKYELLLADLGAVEGDALELAARAVDTDPLKKGAWVTGAPRKLLVGGEGVALQRMYEQILKSEADLKAILAAQNAAADKTIAEMKKLAEIGDPNSEAAKAAMMRWKTVAACFSRPKCEIHEGLNKGWDEALKDEAITPQLPIDQKVTNYMREVAANMRASGSD